MSKETNRSQPRDQHDHRAWTRLVMPRTDPPVTNGNRSYGTPSQPRGLPSWRVTSDSRSSPGGQARSLVDRTSLVSRALEFSGVV